jgi:hypothetical protein
MASIFHEHFASRSLCEREQDAFLVIFASARELDSATDCISGVLFEVWSLTPWIGSVFTLNDGEHWSRHSSMAGLAAPIDSQYNPRMAEPNPTIWQSLSYQFERGRHAASGTFDDANAWAWLIGYGAIWLALWYAGYQMLEPKGPAGVLSVGALSLFAAWAVIFVWRFVFSSPARMHWHSRHDLAAVQTKIMTLESRRPDFRIDMRQVMYGGDLTDGPFGGMSLIMVLLTVINRGTVASALRDWGIIAEYNGKKTPLLMPKFDAVTLGSKEGKVTVSIADMIFEKTAEPIQEGGIANGYVYGFLAGVPKEELDAVKVTVSCRDSRDNVYTGEHILGGGEDADGKPQYLPGTKIVTG